METILKIDNIEKYYGNKSSLTKAIDNISFEVGKGEFVSIMGASGSGKTTLLNCISTLDKVTTGKIYVGGNEITQLKGNKLNKFRREELGFIFQDFNLLDTLTAFENIALALSIQNVPAREIELRVRQTARELGIEEVLNKYPYQMSGGQKQRICIARAILKKPKVLILDDSTSAVDTATDAKIKKAFATKIPGTTKIIVSQRISSIQDADRILVLENGCVSGFDTHENLVENNKVYREIYEVQTEGGGDFDEAGE